MVQGKLHVGAPGAFTKKQKTVQTRHGAARKKQRGVERKVTGAIHRNIEELMAARLIKDGGKLRVVKPPKDVDQASSSRGPKHAQAQKPKPKTHGKLSRLHKKAKQLAAKQTTQPQTDASH